MGGEGLPRPAPGLAGPGVKLLAVVPDGLSRVVFSSPSGLRLRAIVHGDVAAAEVPPHGGRSYSGADTRMTWHDAAGRRIGP